MPVSYIDSDADEIFPTDLTAQNPLRYLNYLNVPNIINTEGESDEPLLRLTITRFTKLNFTSIGMCFSHVLCGFPLDLLRPSRCVDKSCLSRCRRAPAIPRTAFSSIPITRTDRPRTLPRTGSDQIRRTIEGSLANLPSLRSDSPTSVGMAREESDGFRRSQVDRCATHRDPRLCGEGDGTPEDIEGGSGGGIARTVSVGGRTGIQAHRYHFVCDQRACIHLPSPNQTHLP